MVTTPATAADAEISVPAGPQWVVFACDDIRLAVLLERVREIITPRPFTRLPGCGPEVSGLVGLRGRVITVFDFGALLGKRPATETADHRILLVEREERVLGLAVDAVVQIAPAMTEPITTSELPIPDDALIGMGVLGDHSFVAIDAQRLLDHLLL